jgi:FimV-like protein
MWPSTKKENLHWFGEIMFWKTVALFLVLSLASAGQPGRAGATQHFESGRVGCPHCKNDGSEISELLKKADLLYGEFKPKEAQVELLKVLRLAPQNHEALAKLSRVYVDFGDMIPKSEPEWTEKRMEQYFVAQEYARRAVKADPNSTWGHFYVAVSLGKIAALSPIATQVDLAEEIREEVEQAIALDPQNGFAYHVYGVWHRKMAEIGKMSRAVAFVILWRSIPAGSMEKSVDYLRKAISINPKVIASRLELARTYLDMGNYALARNFLNTIEELPIQFSDDPLHKREAQRLLRELRER